MEVNWAVVVPLAILAVEAIFVFAIVFVALYLIVVLSPVSGPGWMVWPILVLMTAVASAAAYEMVVISAGDDDETACASAPMDRRCPTME